MATITYSNRFENTWVIDIDTYIARITVNLTWEHLILVSSLLKDKLYIKLTCNKVKNLGFISIWCSTIWSITLKLHYVATRSHNSLFQCPICRTIHHSNRILVYRWIVKFTPIPYHAWVYGDCRGKFCRCNMVGIILRLRDSNGNSTLLQCIKLAVINVGDNTSLITSHCDY